MRKLIALTCAVAALVIALSVGPSSASAESGYFCWNQTVNNGNKCWGAGRTFYSARAWGNETGVCIGFDTTSGTCAPTFSYASVGGAGGGYHYPWVIGTGSNFTHAFGEIF